MCGIVGYIANRKHGFNHNEVKAFREMLYINKLRGEDSTGIYYVNNKGDVQTHKEVGDSSSFLKSKEWDASEKELFRNGQAVIGHCRASTRGAKTDVNAHPFIVDNKIVLVHNGTYHGSHTDLAKTDVDSHAIAHVLAEEEDIPTALKRINAAYALVWYNTKTGMLHAIRNRHRPLWFAMMEDGSMMFASEVGFLYTAAWRNEMKIHKDYPVMLPEHQLFSCDLSDISKPYCWDDLLCEYEAPAKKEEEPKQAYTKSCAPLVIVPPVTENTKRYYNGVPSLTNSAESLGIGKVTTMGYNDKFYDAIGVGSKVLVEATDYVTVDETAGVYHVFGKIISSNDKANGTIAGWEITAEHEMEVVHYCSEQYYDCVVEYNLSRGVARPGAVITSVWKIKSAEPAQMVPVDTMELN
jgi:predicted glutamine amidotransferase